MFYILSDIKKGAVSTCVGKQKWDFLTEEP